MSEPGGDAATEDARVERRPPNAGPPGTLDTGFGQQGTAEANVDGNATAIVA